MKIDYVTSTRGDYVIVQYYVTIYCEDDGAHFPAYSFSHWFLLKGDEVSKTDDEIYEKVLDGLKGYRPLVQVIDNVGESTSACPKN